MSGSGANSSGTFRTLELTLRRLRLIFALGVVIGGFDQWGSALTEPRRGIGAVIAVVALVAAHLLSVRVDRRSTADGRPSLDDSVEDPGTVHDPGPVDDFGTVGDTETVQDLVTVNDPGTVGDTATVDDIGRIHATAAIDNIRALDAAETVDHTATGATTELGDAETVVSTNAADKLVERLVLAQLALDLIAALAIVHLAAPLPSGGRWMPLLLPLIEAGMRYRLRGLTMLWCVLAVAQFLVDFVQGRPVDPQGSIGVAGFALAIAAATSYLAELLFDMLVDQATMTAVAHQRDRNSGALMRASWETRSGHPGAISAAVDRARTTIDPASSLWINGPDGWAPAQHPTSAALSNYDDVLRAAGAGRARLVIRERTGDTEVLLVARHDTADPDPDGTRTALQLLVSMYVTALETARPLPPPPPARLAVDEADGARPADEPRGPAGPDEPDGPGERTGSNWPKRVDDRADIPDGRSQHGEEDVKVSVASS